MIDRRTLLATLAAVAIPRPSRATDRPIPIGQIGTQHAHAAGKLATIRAFPELFELAGVVEPDPARRERLRLQPPYQGAAWISEEELLHRGDVLAVAVETQVAELVPTALRCIRAGKHIHLDKPGGPSLAPFAELLREASSRALTVQMGYMFRYNPAFQFLFQAVRNGWLGPVREIHGVIGKMAGTDTRRDLARFAGGGMFELGCHLIDALLTVMGPPRSITPFASPSRPDEESCQDNQLAVFQYPGATATIRCNHVDPCGGSRRQFQVIGEQGAIEIRPLEPPSLTLLLDRPRGEFAKGSHQVPLPPPGGRYDGEFRDLAAVIRKETRFAWSEAHDLAVQEAVLRASGMPL